MYESDSGSPGEERAARGHHWMLKKLREASPQLQPTSRMPGPAGRCSGDTTSRRGQPCVSTAEAREDPEGPWTVQGNTTRPPPHPPTAHPPRGVRIRPKGDGLTQL